MEDEICKECKWFLAYEDDNGWGRCKRYPPMVALNEMKGPRFIDPSVNEKNFCGEFEDLND